MQVAAVCAAHAARLLPGVPATLARMAALVEPLLLTAAFAATLLSLAAGLLLLVCIACHDVLLCKNAPRLCGAFSC
jgi:hypothetical protein